MKEIELDALDRAILGALLEGLGRLSQVELAERIPLSATATPGASARSRRRASFKAIRRASTGKALGLGMTVIVHIGLYESERGSARVLRGEAVASAPPSSPCHLMSGRGRLPHHRQGARSLPITERIHKEQLGAASGRRAAEVELRAA